MCVAPRTRTQSSSTFLRLLRRVALWRIDLGHAAVFGHKRPPPHMRRVGLAAATTNNPLDSLAFFVGQPSDPQWFRHSPHRNTPDTPSGGPTYHHRFVVTALDMHVISGGVGGPGDDPDSVVAGLRVSEFNTQSVQLPVSTLRLLGGLRRRLPGVDKRTGLCEEGRSAPALLAEWTERCASRRFPGSPATEIGLFSTLRDAVKSRSADKKLSLTVK